MFHLCKRKSIFQHSKFSIFCNLHRHVREIIQLVGTFLVFFHCSFATCFKFIKKMEPSGWDKKLSSIRSVVDSLLCQNNFSFHWHLLEVPIIPLTLWVGHQGFGGLVTVRKPTFNQILLVIKKFDFSWIVSFLLLRKLLFSADFQSLPYESFMKPTFIDIIFLFFIHFIITTTFYFLGYSFPGHSFLKYAITFYAKRR